MKKVMALVALTLFLGTLGLGVNAASKPEEETAVAPKPTAAQIITFHKYWTKKFKHQKNQEQKEQETLQAWLDGNLQIPAQHKDPTTCAACMAGCLFGFPPC